VKEGRGSTLPRAARPNLSTLWLPLVQTVAHPTRSSTSNISNLDRPENSNAEFARPCREHSEVKTLISWLSQLPFPSYSTALEYFTAVFSSTLASNMVSYQYPGGLIPFGPHSNCTLELCPLEWSILRYRPSLSANAGFTIIFGGLILTHLFQGFYYRTMRFMLCMVAGSALQIVGYVGRVLLYKNPFAFHAFLLQTSEITAYTWHMDRANKMKSASQLRRSSTAQQSMFYYLSCTYTSLPTSPSHLTYLASRKPIAQYHASIRASSIGSSFQ
jgi:hypothetical protein